MPVQSRWSAVAEEHLRILYLEDEPDIAEAVVETLRGDRYEVEWVTSKDEAFTRLAEVTFDLALLDIMIDGDDDAGFLVAASLREAGFEGQVLFLSARDTVEDRVRGLDLGGDDYLVKPFSLQELRARVRALLRRVRQLKRSRFERGPLLIDLVNRHVAWEGHPVDLSPREFAMLEVFVHEPERTFQADELQERLFPGAGSGPTVVRVYVSQLRQKLGEAVIATVPGGYRLGVE